MGLHLNNYNMFIFVFVLGCDVNANADTIPAVHVAYGHSSELPPWYGSHQPPAMQLKDGIKDGIKDGESPSL